MFWGHLLGEHLFLRVRLSWNCMGYYPIWNVRFVEPFKTYFGLISFYLVGLHFPSHFVFGYSKTKNNKQNNSNCPYDFSFLRLVKSILLIVKMYRGSVPKKTVLSDVPTVSKKSHRRQGVAQCRSVFNRHGYITQKVL